MSINIYSVLLLVLSASCILPVHSGVVGHAEPCEKNNKNCSVVTTPQTEKPKESEAAEVTTAMVAEVAIAVTAAINSTEAPSPALAPRTAEGNGTNSASDNIHFDVEMSDPEDTTDDAEAPASTVVPLTRLRIAAIDGNSKDSMPDDNIHFIDSDENDVAEESTTVTLDNRVLISVAPKCPDDMFVNGRCRIKF